MDDCALAAAVERQPAIWDGRREAHSDMRRHRNAWRDLCRLAYPGFDRLPPDAKRDKCLQLQKRWLELRQTYFRWARGVRRRESPDPEMIAKLAFLANVVPGVESSPIEIDDDEPDGNATTPAKRSRSSSAASAYSSDASASASAAPPSISAVSASSSEAPASASASARASAASASLRAAPPSSSADEDEDRYFLLSLVSYMQEVARRDRLALRRDMIALIARYASGAGPAPDRRSTRAGDEEHS